MTDLPKTRKAKGKYDPKSSRIGIHTWTLESGLDLINDALKEKLKDALHNALEEALEPDLLNEVLTERLKEALEIATEEYQVEAYFKLKGMYEVTAPYDPATIFVELPLGPSEDDNPRWEFKLVDLVTDMIDWTDTETGPLYDEDRSHFTDLRDRLRELADMLDKILERPLNNPHTPADETAHPKRKGPGT